MSTTRGQIVTFYSYKGGTGRSMALANIACLLARRYSVLAIDWDLEAPGLHRFFRPLLKERFPLNESGEFELNRHPGLINLFTEIEKSISEDRPVLNQSVVKNLFSQNQLERYILKTSINRLSILKAGSFDDTYSNLINSFPWNSLFERVPWLYLAFGQQLAHRYDFVLIDSRTGLTDTSGICTMLMPDRLVTVFTPNFQSSSGVLDIVRRAVSFRRSSDDLRPLIVFPLVSRIDPTRSVAERSWRFGNPAERIEGYQPQFTKLFQDVYQIESCDLTEYFDQVKIQHNADFAYGERVAVLDTSGEQTTDRLSLTVAYETFLDRLLNLHVPWEHRNTEIEESVKPAQKPLPRTKSPENVSGPSMSAKTIHALYSAFDRFVLEDQRAYYKERLRKSRIAAAQVNRLRTLFLLFTGFASALLAFAITTSSQQCNGGIATPECGGWTPIIIILAGIAGLSPIIALVLSALPDLFQWDRTANLYDVALDNLEVADAQSPLAGMAPDLYAVAYRNYTQVVLNVMMKESNQWGQSLQTPSRLQNYIEEARDSARLAEFNEDDSPVPPLSAEENSYDSAG